MGSLRREKLRQRSRAGFSLVELGIVIAVIAVLASVVMVGKGYLDAAKEKAAVDLVQAIRSSGQAYAMRNYNGIAFGKSEAFDVPGNISLGILKTEHFLPIDTKTPWESAADKGDIKISPDGGTFCVQYGGQNCTICGGPSSPACIRIEFDTPNKDVCADLTTTLGKTAAACSCAGSKFRISTR